MYRWGHVGAALFCYGPVGAALSRAGDPELALAGTVVAVALATVPDIDEFLAIDHRGLTHTVWFVGGGAVLSAAVGVGVGLAIDRPIAVATPLIGLNRAKSRGRRTEREPRLSESPHEEWV